MYIVTSRLAKGSVSLLSIGGTSTRVLFNAPISILMSPILGGNNLIRLRWDLYYCEHIGRLLLFDRPLAQPLS